MRQQPCSFASSSSRGGGYEPVLLDTKQSGPRGVRDVQVRARPGITAVLGANGVGKSTLLKAIFGFLRPEKGSIRLDGIELVGRSSYDMVELGISYIPQQPGIFPHMTVEENLKIGAWSFRRNRKRIAAKLEENCERFPALRVRIRQRAGQLSGGQQRMVEIGRSLMTDPKLILVDEPTAGLAKILTDEAYAMLRELRGEGLTVVLVDQEIRQALKIADYVYVLDLGRNRFEGPPEDFTDLEKAFWT